MPLLEPLVDKNVVRNAQQLFDIQLLINAGDARSSGLVRVLEVLLYAVYEDLTLVCLMYTSQHLDQRRLACAVLADQAEDLARLDCQLHVSQSHYARKNAWSRFFSSTTYSLICISPFLLRDEVRDKKKLFSVQLQKGGGLPQQ